MKVLYLDESGTHDIRAVNPRFPVFAIGGAIVDRAYARHVIGPEMEEFKRKHFGHADVVLHTREMAQGRGEYGFLANPAKRASFYADLNALLAEWEYKVVVCVFEKARFARAYTDPADLYHYGLEIVIERFCRELGDQTDAGYIYAEKRRPDLDRELLGVWTNMIEGRGADYLSARRIEERIVGLELREKKPHYYGLQLADLVVTPPARHVANLAPAPNQVQWSVIEGKLRTHRGRYKGAGLIIRP